MFKVYVGNLDPRTTVDSLKPYFEPFGDAVDEIVLAMDAEGKPRGFAIVLFRDPQRGQLAIETLTGKKINGREVQINESVKKSKRTPPPAREPRNSPLGPRAFQARPGFGPRTGSGGGSGLRGAGRGDARPGSGGTARPSVFGSGGMVRNPRRAGAGPAAGGAAGSGLGATAGGAGAAPGSTSRPLGGASRPLGGSRPISGSRPIGSGGGSVSRPGGVGGTAPGGASRPLGHSPAGGRPTGAPPGGVGSPRAAAPRPRPALSPGADSATPDSAPAPVARPKAVRKKPASDADTSGQ